MTPINTSMKLFSIRSVYSNNRIMFIGLKNDIIKIELIIFLCFHFLLAYSNIPIEIQDNKIFGINKLPPRTAFFPSPNLEEARNSDIDNSSWIKSLNGEWLYFWSPEPSVRPVEFYRFDFPKNNWKKIPVPSTPERQGFGTPIYTNFTYPFQVRPPFVMDTPNSKFTTFKERNPVSSYFRNFTVPKNWRNKRIILHLAGASSGTFVWINGKKLAIRKILDYRLNLILLIF